MLLRHRNILQRLASCYNLSFQKFTKPKSSPFIQASYKLFQNFSEAESNHSSEVKTSPKKKQNKTKNSELKKSDEGSFYFIFYSI